jgi:hypothetical protein
VLRTRRSNAITDTFSGPDQEIPVPVDRLGRWSALAVVALGVLYLILLTRGVMIFGLSTPIGDPILAVMEGITVLSALAITALVAAIAAVAPAARRVYGALALTFTGLFAGCTTVVHIVALTAARQQGTPALVWPSTLYAAELAAWDALLGVGLLFAALALDTGPRLRTARLGLQAAGALCLLGLIGPLLDRMPLQRIGIAGYAVVLPGVCFVLSREFATRGRAPRAAAGTRSDA